MNVERRLDWFRKMYFEDGLAAAGFAEPWIGAIPGRMTPPWNVWPAVLVNVAVRVEGGVVRVAQVDLVREHDERRRAADAPLR